MVLENCDCHICKLERENVELERKLAAHKRAGENCNDIIKGQSETIIGLQGKVAQLEEFIRNNPPCKMCAETQPGGCTFIDKKEDVQCAPYQAWLKEAKQAKDGNNEDDMPGA